MRTFLKKLDWILPALLIAGLLAYPAAVSEAAADAALLWWSRVLPALLPYLVAASLLARSGALLRVRPRLLPVALFLCGALLGYPVGARLADALRRQKVLDDADAERVAVRCNLPNPVFLLSVVSLGFFGNLNCSIPLLLGVYGAALLFALPLLRLHADKAPEPRGLLPNDLPDAIGDGVKTIGVIGGCIVFASVLGALLQSAFHIPQNTVLAVLLGSFEMTCGVRAAAALPLPMSVRLALAAWFVQFGGLSVHLQTALQFPVRLLRYARSKALAALLAAVLTGILTPLFVPETIVPTFASASEIRQNAWALLTVSLAAALGLLFVFVFTVGLGRQKRTP